VARDDAASTVDSEATYWLDGREEVTRLLSWLADAAPHPPADQGGGWDDLAPLADPFAGVEQ